MLRALAARGRSARPALPLVGSAGEGKFGCRVRCRRLHGSIPSGSNVHDQRLPGGRHGAIRSFLGLGPLPTSRSPTTRTAAICPATSTATKLNGAASRPHTARCSRFYLTLTWNAICTRPKSTSLRRGRHAGARTALLAVQNARLTITARCPEQSGDIARYGPALCRSQGGISGRATSCASSA